MHLDALLGISESGPLLTLQSANYCARVHRLNGRLISLAGKIHRMEVAKYPSRR
jgi:hypothetical protein